MKKNFKRRKYFIREGSQPRLILGIQAIFFVLLAIGGAFFYLLTTRSLGQTYSSAHMNIRNVSDIILPTLIGMDVMGAVLSCMATVFFTHRIAGPAFNLGRVLKEIGQGNLAKRVTFRKHDELKELAWATNEMVIGLNSRLSNAREDVRRLNLYASEAARILRSRDTIPGAREAADRLEQAAASLIETFNQFSLREEGDF